MTSFVQLNIISQHLCGIFKSHGFSIKRHSCHNHKCCPTSDVSLPDNSISPIRGAVREREYYCWEHPYFLSTWAPTVIRLAPRKSRPSRITNNTTWTQKNLIHSQAHQSRVRSRRTHQRLCHDTMSPLRQNEVHDTSWWKNGDVFLDSDNRACL